MKQTKKIGILLILMLIIFSTNMVYGACDEDFFMTGYTLGELIRIDGHTTYYKGVGTYCTEKGDEIYRGESLYYRNTREISSKSLALELLVGGTWKEQQRALWNESSTERYQLFTNYLNTIKKPVDITDYNELDYEVDYNSKSIILGKYIVDYTNNQEINGVKLSKVKNISIYKNGDLNSKITNFKIIKASTKEILEYPMPNDEFFIQIPYEQGLTHVSIVMDFEWVTGINAAKLTEYRGMHTHKVNRYTGEEYSVDRQNLAKLKENGSFITETKSIEFEVPITPDTWTFEIDKVYFESLESGKKIQLPIYEEAEFKIEIYRSDSIDSNWNRVQRETDTYFTKDGKIEIKDLTESGFVKFLITETKAPDGYKKLDNPIELIVYKYSGKDGIITYYRLNGFEDELADGAEREDVRILRAPGYNKFTLIIENEPIENGEFAIRLNKYGNGKPLANARFNFDVLQMNGNTTVRNIIVNHKATTNRDGYIFIDKEIINGMSEGEYNLVIREEYVPSGYRKEYYQIKIRFEYRDGKVIITDIYTKKTERDREERISNSEMEDIAYTLWAGKGIGIFIDNTRGNKPSSNSSSYRVEGYDIVLNKILIDNNGKTKDTLEDIKFNIVMKQNGTKVKEWNEVTSAEGKITLSDIRVAGNITLEITEQLTDNQDDLYTYVGNKTKTITFEAVAEQESSRLTRYYIKNNTLNISGNSEGVEIGEILTSSENLYEIGITVKNKGSAPMFPMSIAGTVFVDGLIEKEGQTNGLYGVGDGILQNVEVTLLYADGSDIGQKVTYKMNGDTLLNPIRTNEQGKYEFLGLDPMRKYRVKFTYNGQEYEDTNYFAQDEETTWVTYDYCTDVNHVIDKENWEYAYNTDKWAMLSKASEDMYDSVTDNTRIETISTERADVNARFANIGDYPDSYISATTNKVNAAYSKNTIIDMYDLIAEQIEAGIMNNEQIRSNILAKTDIDIDSSDVEKMLNYIEDCKVSSYTDVYPAFDRFSISDKNNEAPVISGNTSGNDAVYIALYDGQNQINFGLRLRPEVDLRISDTVNKIDVHINEKQETYTYTEIEDVIAYLRTFDIQRNITENQNGEAWYEGNSDDLDIYVTHRIKITNESETSATLTQITEHYNNKYYTFVGAYTDAECTKVLNGVVGNPEGDYTEVKISSTENVKLPELSNNQPQYIYVILKLNGNGKANASAVLSEDTNLLDENGNVLAGKSTSNMNYVEISGYSTGVNVGLVDRDSIAGSFNPTAYETQTGNRLNYLVEDDISGTQVTYATLTEDDPSTTDKNEDYNSRTLSGNVFEDLRNVTDVSGKEIDTTQIKAIDNITVELVEILNNGNYVIRAKTTTNNEGTYTFKDYIPGNYVVRFTYGDKVYTVDGNEAIYNGQNYQSTYANPNTNAITYWYTETDKYSDAYDKVQDRINVIEYANKALVSDGSSASLSMNYYKTEALKNVDYDSEEEYMKKLIEANTVQAYTSTLELEVENAITSANAKSDVTYDIPNIDFGLVKRADSKLTLEQHLSHITITKSDGSILIDTPVTIESNGKIEFVDSTNSDKVHFQYISTPNSYGVGTAKLEIDDEILIGNIDLEYTITLRNDTENETTLTYYKDSENNIIAIAYYEELEKQLVYWEGQSTEGSGIRYYEDSTITTKTDISKDIEKSGIVATQAKNIINYVSTNLNYDSVKNGDTGAVWKLITSPDDTLRKINASGDLDKDNATAVNNEACKEYNQLLLATGNNMLINTVLTPGNEVKETLVLSATNTQDVDLNYYNVAEILELENSAGRVDTYSIPGNLNPSIDYTHTSNYSSGVVDYNITDIKAYEPDSSKAEHVLITDTTGDTHYYYVLIGAVLVIFATGIVLIKKFVLDPKA